MSNQEREIADDANSLLNRAHDAMVMGGAYFLGSGVLSGLGIARLAEGRVGSGLANIAFSSVPGFLGSRALRASVNASHESGHKCEREERQTSRSPRSRTIQIVPRNRGH